MEPLSDMIFCEIQAKQYFDIFQYKGKTKSAVDLWSI